MGGRQVIRRHGDSGRRLDGGREIRSARIEARHADGGGDGRLRIAERRMVRRQETGCRRIGAHRRLHHFQHVIADAAADVDGSVVVIVAGIDVAAAAAVVVVVVATRSTSNADANGRIALADFTRREKRGGRFVVEQSARGESTVAGVHGRRHGRRSGDRCGHRRRDLIDADRIVRVGKA